MLDNVAEWSKAPALGAGLARGVDPRSDPAHSSASRNKKKKKRKTRGGWGASPPTLKLFLAFPSDDTTKSFPHRDATARHRRTPPYRKITVERRSRPAGREWWTRRSEPPHSSTRPTTTRSTASSGGSWPRRRSTSAPQPAGARRVCTCTRVHELSAQARRRSEDLTPAASTTSERSAMLAHPSTGLVARAPCQLRQSRARLRQQRRLEVDKTRKRGV